MRESVVEKHLIARVKEIGGLHRKLAWIERHSAPDQFIAYHGVYLVECKRPTKDATEKQAREHERLRAQGVDVTVATTIEQVDMFIYRLQRKAAGAAAKKWST